MVGMRYGTMLMMMIVLAAGCRNIHGERDAQTATEVYSDKMNETKCRGLPAFQDMTDNAILQDMALADFHFVAHTAEISGTGAARLDRMAHLLEAYGGTVNYETYEDDATLVEQRLTHVREYLALTGCNMSRVEVKAMMSDGRTIPAKEAIAIAERGTVKAASTTDPGGAPMAMQAP